MTQPDQTDLLTRVQAGELSPEEGVLLLDAHQALDLTGSRAEAVERLLDGFCVHVELLLAAERGEAELPYGDASTATRILDAMARSWEDTGDRLYVTLLAEDPKIRLSALLPGCGCQLVTLLEARWGDATARRHVGGSSELERLFFRWQRPGGVA